MISGPLRQWHIPCQNRAPLSTVGPQFATLTFYHSTGDNLALFRVHVPRKRLNASLTTLLRQLQLPAGGSVDDSGLQTYPLTRYLWRVGHWSPTSVLYLAF